MKIEADDHGGYLVQFEFYSLHFDTKEAAEDFVEAKYYQDMRRNKKIRVTGKAARVKTLIEMARAESES